MIIGAQEYPWFQHCQQRQWQPREHPGEILVAVRAAGLAAWEPFLPDEASVPMWQELFYEDYFAGLAEPPRLDSVAEIFRVWNTMHAALKEQYYLQPGEDKEDELESSRMDVLIANPRGIFGVAAHRTVQEFSKFYAYGSGSPYALGAMYAAYRAPSLDAEAVARLGVTAAAEFHDESGLPLQSYVIETEE
jgi:hypothetical protein